MLALDDFYKDGDDPTLPTVGCAVDWDDPASWHHDAALAAIATICAGRACDVPIYAIGADRCVGHRRFELGGAPLFVAEGIFAAELVADCARLGLLAGAYSLRRPRTVTYLRRLARDLSEKRKPPALLVRRGYALMRAEPGISDRQRDLGARPASGRRILREVAAMTRAPSRTPA
ncbi:ATP-binding protein [Luedemannella helvata]|uniref:ATP-binding protein n=1 Tax=Luedemannella helvata TaxID=349315 RepID=UPI0031E0BD85